MRSFTSLAKKKLLSSLNDAVFDPDLEIFEKTFADKIYTATYKMNSKRTPKSWWHSGLEKNFRLMWAAIKKYNKVGSPENCTVAIRDKDEWKYVVAMARSSKYNSRINELNSNPYTKDAWRFVNNMRMLHHGKTATMYLI